MIKCVKFIYFWIILENPTDSIENAGKHFQKSNKKIQTTLKKYKYHPYKVLPVQELNERQKNLRIEYCQEMLRRFEQDPNIFKKILWTDEATFTTSGVFNRRNSHVWATHNPKAISEIKIQGRQSVHIWCGILYNRVIGPILYEGSLTGNRYLNFLEHQIENLLEDLPLGLYNTIIWHQDGAPPHNVVPVTTFLNDRFNCWIGRHGHIHWPPNSPDLTPMDSFLWGYLKNIVYAEGRTTLEELRRRILDSIETLKFENRNFLANAINKIENDYIKCIENNGGHIEQL